MKKSYLRDQITYFGRSLFERGFTVGSSGNISVRVDDGWLITPTNCCLGTLDPARITRLDAQGRVLAGDSPTKQRTLHVAVYERRNNARADSERVLPAVM